MYYFLFLFPKNNTRHTIDFKISVTGTKQGFPLTSPSPAGFFFSMKDETVIQTSENCGSAPIKVVVMGEQMTRGLYHTGKERGVSWEVLTGSFNECFIFNVLSYESSNRVK